MKTKRNPLWQRAALWTVAGLLGLQLNAAEQAAWLGVSVGAVADAVRHQLQLPRGAGLTVEGVADDSPASKAGLEQHDVLQKVDDQWLFNADQLTRLIRSYEPGSTVQLTVVRGGKTESLTATLVEHEVSALPGMGYGSGFGGGGLMGGSGFGAGGMPGFGGMGGMSGFGASGGMGGGSFGGTGFDQRPLTNLVRRLRAAPILVPMVPGQATSGRPTAFLGVELRVPDETLLEQLDRPREEGGVLIEQVIDDSPAAKAGLLKHDLIIELDGKNVADPRQFADIIGRWKPGDRVTLRLLREGEAKELQVELGKREAADARQLQQLQQQFMVAPEIEVNTLPDQSGSVIIMRDERGVGGFGGGTAGGSSGFGGGFGAGAGFGTGSPAGGTSAGGPPYNVEVRATSHATQHGTKTVQTRLGTVISRDPAGEITVRQDGDNRHVTVRDADGNVLFEGDVSSDTDREKLSPEIRTRLEKADELLQQNLDQPEGPAVQRQLRVIEKGGGPDFIRHEEQEVLIPAAPIGV